MVKKEREANVVAVFRAALMRRAERLETLEALWEILPQATRERVAAILNEIASLYAVIDARLYNADSEVRLAIRKIREDGTAFDELLKKALVERRDRYARRDHLTSALVASGLITQQEALAFLSKQFGVPSIDLDALELDPGMVRFVPRDVAVRHRLIMLGFRQEPSCEIFLRIAMADPTNVSAADDVVSLTGHRLEIYVASSDAIARAIDKYYAEPPPEPPPPPAAAA